MSATRITRLVDRLPWAKWEFWDYYKQVWAAAFCSDTSDGCLNTETQSGLNINILNLNECKQMTELLKTPLLSAQLSRLRCHKTSVTNTGNGVRCY